jgi:hypothetical protein
LEFEGKGVRFEDETGHGKNQGDNDVFLMLKGIIQTPTDIETIKTRTRFNLTGTLLTGGIPIWRKVDEKTTRQTIQSEFFIRLYSKESPVPEVEILQQRVNYYFMGDEMAASSLINFDNTVRRLREAFPLAIFDDRLTKPYAVNAYSNRFDEDIEIKCRLIYAFYTASKNPDQGK